MDFRYLARECAAKVDLVNNATCSAVTRKIIDRLPSKLEGKRCKKIRLMEATR